MFTFPLAYLLIPFGLIFAFALLFFFFNIFHFQRYAVRSRGTTIVLSFYFAGFALLTLLAAGYLLNIDWTERFEITDLIPSFQSSSRI